jgi:hypothetical protein
MAEELAVARLRGNENFAVMPGSDAKGKDLTGRL